MVDYKERMTNAKEYLYTRLRAKCITVNDAEKRAEQFYEYNKEVLLTKPIEHFIYRMENFDETSIVYDRKTEWYEIDNVAYNVAFEAKLLSLIKSGLEKVSPDFCEYTVAIELKPIWQAPNVKEKHLVIVMSIKE